MLSRLGSRSPRDVALNLLRTVSDRTGQCPCHGHNAHLHHPFSSQKARKETAFEMAASCVRYGVNVTSEIGMDVKEFKNVLLVTDPNLLSLHPVQTAVRSLQEANVNFKIYDKVRVEPTDESMKHAIAFARKNNFDAYIAVGGGSVIDTVRI